MIVVMSVCKRWRLLYSKFINLNKGRSKEKIQYNITAKTIPRIFNAFLCFFSVSYFFSVVLLFTRISANIKYARIMTSTPFENDYFKCKLVIQLMKLYIFTHSCTLRTYCWQCSAWFYSSSLKYWNEFRTQTIWPLYQFISHTQLHRTRITNRYIFGNVLHAARQLQL